MKYQGADLATFPEQIEYALSHFTADISHLKGKINHVIICGLGGSGIAGRITKAYLSSKSSVSIELVADYSLPATATSESLIICSSYSGNTEETLSCFKEASAIGASIICITGGGNLGQLANENGYPLFHAVPGLQPRMALGYSLTYLLLIFETIAGVQILDELKAAIDKLKKPDWHKGQARAIMTHLGLTDEKFLQVVSDAPGFAMSVRMQQQLNENSKIWAQVHEMPEMCHNVIEAITHDNLHGPWLLVNSGTNERNNMRFDYLSNLLKEKGYNLFSLNMDTSSLGNLLDGIFISDWLSLLIADNHALDSSAIPNIKGLKAYLS